MNLIKEGQVFKNFKTLCVSMGWIDENKTLSTCTKKKFEKDLSQICDWRKIEGTNKIIIIEVYSVKKKRIDGRNKDNKYVDYIEKILVNNLGERQDSYFLSNRMIVKILRLYNYELYRLIEERSSIAKKLEVDAYFLKFLLSECNSEINKIISRAMKSMLKSGIIEGQCGFVLKENNHIERMASVNEEAIIKEIEKEVLKEFNCKNKGSIIFNDLIYPFQEKVLYELCNKGYEGIEYYYSGYCIELINIVEEEKLEKKEIQELSIELKKVVIKRLMQVGENIHNRAVAKEYEKMAFGQPMLVDFRCAKNFIFDWNKTIEYLLG